MGRMTDRATRTRRKQPGRPPDGALEAAEHAIDIESEDAELQGNLGLVLILSGRPVEAIEPLRTAIRLAGEDVRTMYRNFLGLAYFHAVRFLDSIEAIESNRKLGGPMGPHMYAYLTAAHSISAIWAGIAVQKFGCNAVLRARHSSFHSPSINPSGTRVRA